MLSAIVTLDSIEIYKTHEILKAVKPEVYFQCKGESRTDLPDVKKSNQLYTFKGEESWQVWFSWLAFIFHLKRTILNSLEDCSFSIGYIKHRYKIDHLCVQKQ